MLIFLAVAFYLDFSCATRVATYDKFQDNYILISTNNSERQKEIEELLNGETYFSNVYTSGTGEALIDDEHVQNLYFETLLTDRVVTDIYYGRDDDIFSDYEKYKILYGRSIFENADEVIVSEEFASYVSAEANKSLGKKVAITVDDYTNYYTIVGIYAQTMSESRGNRQYRSIINRSKTINSFSEEPGFLTFNIFLANESFAFASNYYNREYKTYVFAEDEKAIAEIRTALDVKRLEDSDKLDFSYIAPQDADRQKKDLQSYLLFQKSIIMLVVMIISGINIFGTMAGLIAERKNEIGIKKAMGASDFDIMIGFFIENIISVFKAIVVAAGITSTLAIIYAIYQRHILFNDYQIAIYPATVILLLSYILSSTLGFSLIPSYKASRINIIDTIRAN
jgi:putative ABC transport system permease protein